MPLHKSGPKSRIENDRPISLLPKLSLVFEKILFAFLYDSIKSLISPKQFGFQSRKSAVLQLIDYLETVRNTKSMNLYTVYMDYAKAFDKVPHTILISKCKKFGLDDF